ncbi:putative methyltransferase NSUN6 [Agrilus planipennis]|uniref:Methyltransferase NSUN6 n=1 Tax=Agrilus planipennis TaxID=224129 RepID=A0A7F5RJK5_AGRPL|nr:putative methyltransferase NSUN6 [Agrilus planipennis]
MSRHQLFGANLNPTGIAVEITDTISGCLPLNEYDVLPENSFLLQNIPSVICVRTLNPTHDDVILDMCASPGNKTTHIANLMKNKATLIAIDKTPSKIERLRTNCNKFNTNVHIFQADSTKIFDGTLDESKSVVSGPPFCGESFDKILLDAPCSALGKRPQFPCKINNNTLKSFVPLQRKLFEVAANLLKPGGTLVYSTCTITVAENEEIVAWALKKFSSLKLVKVENSFGTRGFFVNGLNDEQLSCLQRFDSDCDIDSVGFFIACFVKR